MVETTKLIGNAIELRTVVVVVDGTAHELALLQTRTQALLAVGHPKRIPIYLSLQLFFSQCFPPIVPKNPLKIPLKAEDTRQIIILHFDERLL